MGLKEKLLAREATLGVIGLGYVGLPLAVEKAKAGALERRLDLPETLKAPVAQGQQVGTLTLCSGGQEVLSVPVLAAEDVPGRSWGRMFTELLHRAAFLA